LIKINLDPGRPSRLLIAGAPEGQDARILADIAKRRGAGGLLHVSLDDHRMARLAEAVAFFAPEVELIQIPAWDCLPYDRVSPNVDIVSRRVEGLTRLIEPSKGRARLILTTVNALAQKVPPRGAFTHATFRARIGDRIDLDKLQAYLAHNGYTRAQTVREPGEFAIRGGIIDLFPPGTEEPLRLDLFGDELEGVRAFDPMSQRTTEKRDGIALKPMSEVFLDEQSIARFRSGYRELFGVVLDEDPLYEAVSAGRKHGGMEHWLPLFHSTMETILDYAPNAVVTLDPQAEESRDARFSQIADFYHARKTLQSVEKKANNPVYKPLPLAGTIC
jgi:transcription-repair coupling factor (superfamily II helicase)